MSCPDPLYDYEDFLTEEEQSYDGWEELMSEDEWLDNFQGEEDFA